jgi:hypothetical protein
MLFGKTLDNTIQVWIAGAKAPREPIPTPLRDFLSVRNHVELPGLP